MQATGPTSLRVAYQQQHVEALEVLQQCLSELCQDQPDMLAGLFIFLHHPDNKSWWGSKGVSGIPPFLGASSLQLGLF